VRKEAAMDLAFTKLLPETTPNEDEDGGLRPLDWAGLCARLAAAQQLRRELERQGSVVRASFAPVPVRLPSGVNPVPLTDSKAGRRIGREREMRRDNQNRGQQ
jgi:hypothetical protein